MSYGPRMTAKLRKALKAEIAAFDKAKTLREIEENAIGKRDINAYTEWSEEQNMKLDPRAEPNQFTEDDVFPWGQAGNASAEDTIRLAKIKELLTEKQYAVWKLCMREALTQQEAARRLQISQPTLAVHLKKGLDVVTAYFTKQRLGATK